MVRLTLGLMILASHLFVAGCGGGGGGGGGSGDLGYVDILLPALRADLYADLADDQLNDMVVIDTSSEFSFSQGAIPGAISIPLQTLRDQGLAAMVYPDEPFIPGAKVGTQIPLDTRLIFYLGGSG